MRVKTSLSMVWAAIAIAAMLGAAPAGALGDGAHVLAPTRYRPVRNWCPTNRTCFSDVSWAAYTSHEAVGQGDAKSCPGGGPTAEDPCQQVSNVEVELTAPRHVCGALRFTRLKMFGRTFRLNPVICFTYL